MAATAGKGSSVTVQYLQVYLYDVYDLLGDAQVALKLTEEMEGSKGELRVAGAREVDVSTAAEVTSLMVGRCKL